MVTAKTHDIGALVAVLAVYQYFGRPVLGWATTITALIASMVGALLPDIDQASNRLWDLLPVGNLIGRVLRRLFLSHRTISHSLLGLVVIYLVADWVIVKLFNPSFVNPTIVLIALMTGYISHILLDALTEDGVPLLFPIKWRFGFPPWRRMRIKTNHWFERWVVLPTLVAAVVFLLGSVIS